MKYGVLVSTPNKSAAKSTTEDLSVNTDLPILMIHKSGTARSRYPGVSDGSNLTDTITINHGLGYEPAFLGYIYRDENAPVVGGIVASQVGFFVYGGGGCYASADKDNLYIGLYNVYSMAMNAVDWVVKYYIFKNKINIAELNENKSIYYDREED